jgi:hypothetical protein
MPSIKPFDTIECFWSFIIHIQLILDQIAFVYFMIMFDDPPLVVEEICATIMAVFLQIYKMCQHHLAVHAIYQLNSIMFNLTIKSLIANMGLEDSR